MIRRVSMVALALCCAVLLPSIASGDAAAVTHAATYQGAVSQSQPVTLLTGQRVLVTKDGDGHILVSTLSQGAAAPLVTYELAGAEFVLPNVAAQFVGGQLDPSLFDTAALQQAEANSGGDVPVQVTWQGSTPPSMPWLLDAHSAGAGTTDGVVSPSSAASLDTALAQGPLPGVEHIALLGGSVSVPPSPNFVQYTETVYGINASGHPDNGDFAIVMNVDNGLKFNALEMWYHGFFKISVPAGHYSALGTFTQLSAQGVVTGIRLVIINFTVTANGAVTLDARDATAPVMVSTPLPVASGFATVTWQRTDAKGFSADAFSDSWQIGNGAPPVTVQVSPVAAPAYGTSEWITSYHLDGPPSANSAIPYSYDLVFGSSGAISADQEHVVTTAQLAQIQTRYYSDVANRQTIEFRSGLLPGQFFSSGVATPFNAPLRRTEYVSAGPDIVWTQDVFEDPLDFSGQFVDSPTVFEPGEISSANWGNSPNGPGIPIDTGSAVGIEACPACTEAKLLEFAIFPFGDNPPGHQGYPNFAVDGIAESDSFSLTSGGTTIATGTDPLFLGIPVSGGRARYQLAYDVSMSAPWWTRSTSTATTWSFSSPQATQLPLPPNWVCGISGQSAGCTVIGLMFPNYQLPLRLDNTMASGAVTWELGIEHVLNAAVAVTSATVSVSFNGGTTWSAATVQQNSGGFAVSYTNPSSGAVTLRIHVTDADGSVLDQTVQDAYGIS